MGTKIKEGIQIDELREDMMFAIGNTDIDDQASVTSAKQIKEYTDSDKAEVAFTGSYLSLTDTPILDSYVTIQTLNQNYYNKNQINQIIGGVTGPKFEKVEELPEIGENGIIYLVPDESAQSPNIFDEYVWLPDGQMFERIGSTMADFDNYYTIDEVNALIPAVNNPTITFKQGQTTVGTITLNQSSNSTLTFSAIGTAQIPSDWDQTDTTAPDYIKNKPTIPVVNDSTITFTQGGVTIGRFSLNQDRADTIDLSDISQVQANWNESNTTSAAYIQNKPSIPTVNNPTITFTQGGVIKGSITLNQSSGGTIQFDTTSGVQSDWDVTDTTSPAYINNKPNLATVATTGSYSDLTNKPNLATVATTGSYSDLTNKPTIPTNTRSLLVTYDNQTTETIVVYVQ